MRLTMLRDRCGQAAPDRGVGAAVTAVHMSGAEFLSLQLLRHLLLWNQGGTYGLWEIVCREKAGGVMLLPGDHGCAPANHHCSGVGAAVATVCGRVVGLYGG